MASSISGSRAGGPANTGIAGRHGRSCPRMRSDIVTVWSGGTSRRRFAQLIQGLHGEHRGKPYAGNPHVRFDEGLLVRALRTADWGLLHPTRWRLRAALRTLARSRCRTQHEPARFSCRPAIALQRHLLHVLRALRNARERVLREIPSLLDEVVPQARELRVGPDLREIDGAVSELRV